MSKIVQEASAGIPFTRITPNYDSTKWNLGSIINQFNTGDGPFIGPNPIAVARPFEESTGFAVRFPYTIQFSPTIDWIFVTENGGGPTERVMLYEYDKINATYNWQGFITCTLNTAATHTLRGFAVGRYIHNTGSIQVSGSRVTGFGGTNFISNRIAAGARIAFGTTDPVSASLWYPIASISAENGLTCSLSAPTASYSSYVIEELRPMWTTTNSAATNGGLFVTKGVNFGDFTTAGTTIAASAGTVDNKKLGYWLADPGPTGVTNTASAGLVIEPPIDNSTQYAYVLELATPNARVFKYNVRSTGSITAGKMSLPPDAAINTGYQGVTGTLSQINNGVLATARHGPGSGSQSLYFLTGTRFYRADTSLIYSGNTAWISDNRTEVPPGGINTYAATGVLSTISYSPIIDRFLIVSTGATAFRHYVTAYPTTSGNQWNHIFGVDTKQLDQGAADSANIPRLDGVSTAISVDCNSGVFHFVKMGTTATTTQMYAVPMGAHWTYANLTNNIAISPEIATPNCNKFSSLCVAAAQYIGPAGSTSEIGYIAPEPFRAYYRTSGIADNSGGWSLIPKNGDISGAGSGASIQFMFDFKTIGNGFLMPAQIYGVAVSYEDLSTDSHYQPSVGNSSITNKEFAWRFSTAFGGSVPTLQVKLFDAVTNGLLLADTTATSGSGVWSKSTNGGSSWGTYDNADKTNETTYIKYVPTSLADNTKVRALLLLN